MTPLILTHFVSLDPHIFVAPIKVATYLHTHSNIFALDTNLRKSFQRTQAFGMACAKLYCEYLNIYAYI